MSRSSIEFKVPETKKWTGQICHLSDNTGAKYSHDLDSYIHSGYTIGKGKQLYWEIIWHTSGHCTVYPINGKRGRYIKGDQIVTLHFK